MRAREGRGMRKLCTSIYVRQPHSHRTARRIYIRSSGSGLTVLTGERMLCGVVHYLLLQERAARWKVRGKSGVGGGGLTVIVIYGRPDC